MRGVVLCLEHSTTAGGRGLLDATGGRILGCCLHRRGDKSHFQAKSLCSEVWELRPSPCKPCLPRSCSTGAACVTNTSLFPSCWKLDSTKTLSEQLITSPAVAGLSNSCRSVNQPKELLFVKLLNVRTQPWSHNIAEVFFFLDDFGIHVNVGNFFPSQGRRSIRRRSRSGSRHGAAGTREHSWAARQGVMARRWV